MRDPGLKRVRARIDELDARIVGLLCRRLLLAKKTARFKKRGLRSASREAKVMGRAKRRAREDGLPPELLEAIYRAIIAGSVKIQVKRK
ncbi:MAG: chorismate mutase [Elusimicrobiota bacterium]